MAEDLIKLPQDREYEIQNEMPNNMCIMADSKPLITISAKDGFVFHKENFPNYTPDDFAKRFIEAINEYLPKCECKK